MLLFCRRLIITRLLHLSSSSSDHHLSSSSSDHHLTSSPDFTNQHHLQPSSRWPLQVSRHRDEDRLLCQPSSHDKTRHRQTQQKRLRGHGGPGGVSLYWRQRRSQLRMRRGYSAVSGGTCGVAWGASRTVARPLATTGTLRGCILAFFPLTGVVLGVWWRVGEIGCRGLSFPFF